MKLMSVFYTATTLYHTQMADFGLSSGMSSVFVVCVCRLQLSAAFVVCVFRLRVPSACVVCICRLRLSPACNLCVFCLRLPSACVVCICRRRLPSACVVSMCRLHVSSAFVVCVLVDTLQIAILQITFILILRLYCKWKVQEAGPCKMINIL